MGQEEKIEIAKKYLVPKQRKEHGLKAKQFKLTDAILAKVVDEYTRESGVRGLEKKIASLARYRAKQIVGKEDVTANITAKDVVTILGNQRIEKEQYQNNDTAGVVTGLAWTSVGGEILFVESSMTKGKGKL